MCNAMRSLAGGIATDIQIAALTGRADEIEHVEWGTALEITEEGNEELFGSYEDFCKVVDSVKQMADDPFMGGEPEEVYAELFRETVAEVRRLWPEVAEALQVRKYLNGDEVSRLIESARKREE
jgi:Asp-tRNA(Asn)/Glu-tRNA(Gln) amidotransferase C subunit